MTSAPFCYQVLTERRVNQLAKKPLQSVEFIAPLARMDPVYTEEEEAFKVRTVIHIRNQQKEPKNKKQKTKTCL